MVSAADSAPATGHPGSAVVIGATAIDAAATAAATSGVKNTKLSDTAVLQTPLRQGCSSSKSSRYPFPVPFAFDHLGRIHGVPVHRRPVAPRSPISIVAALSAATCRPDADESTRTAIGAVIAKRMDSSGATADELRTV